MRRRLQVQVPSSLQIVQSLRIGPLTIASATSSTRSIRQTYNTVIRNIGSRPFSAQSSCQSAIRIPIQSNIKISNKSRASRSKPSASTSNIVPLSGKESAFVSSHTQSLENDPITVMTHIFIHKQQYEKIVPFLLEHKSQVTSRQLEKILKELEVRDQASYIIQIHKKFPSLSFENEQIVKLLLRVTFQSSEYALFEIIFSRYLEFPKQSSRYCNMALKAVISNRNQEFAKQLLYQMVQSHLPMNLATLKVFLKSVRKSGTFQSIKFVVDLLEKNPNIPVDQVTFSLIMKCYAETADEIEIEKFSSFLQSRKCDLFEFELYQFYESLRHARSIDYDLVWLKIEEIRPKIMEKKSLLQTFYYELMSVFAVKHRREDLFRMVDYIAEDVGEFSPRVHSLILFYFSITGDVEGILRYFNVFKKRSLHIQPLYINALWRTLIRFEPDLAEEITIEFKKFIEKVYTHSQLEHRHLKTINLRETGKLPSFRPEIPDGQLSKSIDYVKRLLKDRRDHEIIAFINDELRQGLRPHLQLLNTALLGLIKIRSSDSLVIYRLSCQLYKADIVEFDILWLRKIIYDIKDQEPNIERIHEMGGGLIRDLLLKHETSLVHHHYNVLANLAIEIFNYDLAFELLSKARGSAIESEKRDNTSIYVSLLKVFARKADSENFLFILNVAHTEEDLKLTKYFLKRANTYKQYFKKLNSQGKFKNFKDFQAKFASAFGKIKDRYTAQQEQAKANCQKSISFLEEWNKKT